MTIYQRMDKVFAVAGVPGFFQTWRRTDLYPELPELYAVYNVTVERPAQSADDREIFRRYDVELLVYVPDVAGAVEALRDALQIEGFSLPRDADARARLNGEHIENKQIRAVFVDFGEYGPE